jgi:hypothetical protein
MLRRRIIVIALALLFVARTTIADTVVLRDQRRYVGTVANRDMLAENPGAAKSVSILVTPASPDTASLLRFPVADVEYVVLEDGQARRVVDFAGLSGATQLGEVTGSKPPVAANATPMSRGGAPVLPSDTTRPAPSKQFSSYWKQDGRSIVTTSSPKDVGIPLLILGVGAAITGIAVKFGGEKLTVSGGTAQYEEKSYNGVNYALMICGGISTVAGIAVLSQPPKRTALDADHSIYVGVLARR